jgi:branched-chain amino acid transport system permease protein
VTRGRRLWGPARWIGLLLALLATACGGADDQQLRLCRTVVPAVEDVGTRIEITESGVDPAAENAVVVRYRSTGTTGETAEHWVSCRFAGRGFESGRLKLTGLATDREGELSPVKFYFLRRFWVSSVASRTGAGVAGGDLGKSLRGRLLYLLQQLVNSIVPACVYGLLAVGYSLVYAIIGRINLAFGEMAMIGAYGTIVGVTLLAVMGADPLRPALLLVLVLAMAVSGIYGWVTERIVFRPLRGAGTQAPLIATIGLAIFLQEYLRLAQGARERWLQPIFTERLTLAGAEVFPVYLTGAQGLVLALTILLYGALLQLWRHSRFGRDQRACAQDSGMAALCGVPVDRTVGLAFALGAAYGATAGLIVALYYGGVSFHMGFMLGFKALVAAVVGGLGSVAGAMVGGLVVALVETFWSAYLTLDYEGLAVFGLLALFLVVRPQGLLGARESARPRPV